jgi:hypothetical protein
MTTGLQVLMGVSLGACSGLRACLPLLILGLMARYGVVPIGPAFALLTHVDTLVVLGIATTLEFLGDKVIVVDHLLDAAGTVARPVAGTILASATLTHLDPKMALLLGLVVGGGSALSVHAGKAVTRAKATALAPLHGGVGNIGLSLCEDVVVAGGLWLAVHAPIVAFVLAVLLISVSLLMVYIGVKTGKKVFAFFKTRSAVS